MRKSGKTEALEHLEAGEAALGLDNERAVFCLAQAIQLDPKLADAHLALGNALLHRERPDRIQALASFEEAARLEPANGEARLCAGIALAGMRRWDAALAHLNRARRLLPDDARVPLWMAWCSRNTGRNEEAINQYRAGISLRPAYGEMVAHMNLADVLVLDGRLPEAADEWRLEARPKSMSTFLCV